MSRSIRYVNVTERSFVRASHVTSTLTFYVNVLRTVGRTGFRMNRTYTYDDFSIWQMDGDGLRIVISDFTPIKPKGLAHASLERI